MKKFIGHIKTDVDGSICRFEFEVEDNATPEEIETAARFVAFEFIDWGYKEVGEIKQDHASSQTVRLTDQDGQKNG